MLATDQKIEENIKWMDEWIDRACERKQKER